MEKVKVHGVMIDTDKGPVGGYNVNRISNGKVKVHGVMIDTDKGPVKVSYHIIFYSETWEK